jgi:hypothetical protein
MPLSPYPVRIRWPVDCLRGIVRPVNAPRGTHHTPGSWMWGQELASRCRQRWGASLAVTSRDSTLVCHQQAETERRSGASSPA